MQTIDQQMYLQGFQTVITLYLASQVGITPGGDIYTDAVVDRSNVDRIDELMEAGYR